MIVHRTANGGPPVLSIDVSPEPLGYRQLAALDAVSAIPDVPARACRALVSVSGAAVRWRDDGQDPTAQLGMPVSPGETFEYLGDVSALRFIGPGASLDVSLYL
jgi:hypothetical protein